MVLWVVGVALVRSGSDQSGAIGLAVVGVACLIAAYALMIRMIWLTQGGVVTGSAETREAARKRRDDELDRLAGV